MTETAKVLRTWVVDGGLDARVADGETGHAVVARVTAALRTIAAENQGAVVALVGTRRQPHRRALRVCAGSARTSGVGRCRTRCPSGSHTDGRTWRCPEWPG